jgi:PPM family protein phosphatase
MPNMDEITAPFAPAEIAPPPPLEVKWRYVIAARTDMGRVRENNEDKFEFYIPEDEPTLARRGAAFIVCDGMGGHEAGQIASELAAKTWIDVYFNHPGQDPADAARDATLAANRFVFDRSRAIPKYRDMGTTLTALVVVQGRAIVAQVGDSRCYRRRAEETTCLTTDQTWVEETVAAGVMSREEAEAHPYRHVILQAIGTNAELNPAIGDHEAQDGDVYLLCSDGVTNHVDDEALHLALEHPCSAAAWSLVNQALAGGGSDNATVIVVRLEKAD